VLQLALALPRIWKNTRSCRLGGRSSQFFRVSMLLRLVKEWQPLRRIGKKPNQNAIFVSNKKVSEICDAPVS
jgi:hypothetical protein